MEAFMTAPTTVVIDKELLAEAKRVLGAKTTRETVDKALREAVWRRRMLDGLDAMSELNLDLDPQKVDIDPDELDAPQWSA